RGLWSSCARGRRGFRRRYAARRRRSRPRPGGDRWRSSSPFSSRTPAAKAAAAAGKSAAATRTAAPATTAAAPPARTDPDVAPAERTVDHATAGHGAKNQEQHNDEDNRARTNAVIGVHLADRAAVAAVFPARGRHHGVDTCGQASVEIAGA